MKIVIAGAGDIGFHLAKLLSFEQKNIVLIDINAEVLEYAQSHLDVQVIRGDSGSVGVLKEAGAEDADLFLAVTTSEKTNLVTAILAKKMGARQTIARVSNIEYLDAANRELFQELGIDSLISPRALAAQEIERLVKQRSLTDHFEFEEGKISLFGITLEHHSPAVNRTIDEITAHHPGIRFKPIAILRGHQTIIPRGGTVLLRNDHLYFITSRHQIKEVLSLFGKEIQPARRIMIVGGTDVGIRTAELLEKDYHVTIVEDNKNICKDLVETLKKTLVVKGDPGNIELLREEGLEQMDVFIAVTPNSETNIITSLMAKECGIAKTIALVENADYTHISQNIGVDTIINKKLIAANNIFRYVRKGKIEAITSLHGVDAEIIEFVVQKSNRLTRVPLRELHFPEHALIGGVIRRDESMIPDGNFQLQLDDKVIVFALPEAIQAVEKMFR
ncbi:MAG: Trk system potassium transporter TrkA [Saprospiraceae bacterium]|nr:Trk system potassium transporter TrkA [Saprospiraceae bacterium]